MRGIRGNRCWQPLLLTLLLAGVGACTAYYREGPPPYRAAYYHYPY